MGELRQGSAEGGAYQQPLEDVQALFTRLAQTLELAVRVRSGPSNTEVGPIEELFDSGWVMSADGLDYAGDEGEPYRLSYSELLKRTHADVDQMARGGPLSIGWSEAQARAFGCALL